MTWRDAVRDALLFTLLAAFLIYWGSEVLWWVQGYFLAGALAKMTGALPLLAPDLIAYFIIGATVGAATGLLFPRDPIVSALGLWLGMGLLLPAFEWMSWLSAVMPRDLSLIAAVLDAGTLLVFLTLFAHLTAKLRRRWLADPSQLTSDAA